MVLEGLYKSKLQDSVQHQTVLAMYEEENVLNNEPPSYFRLKTLVRRHIDQTMRTHNFRARIEMVERGVVTKSQKGRKACAERKVGECCWWKAIGQCSNSFMIERLETDAVIDEKDNRPLLHQKRRHGRTERNHQKAAEEKVLLEHEADLRAHISLGESARTRHVVIGTSPCVSITSLNQDANLATNANSDTLRLMGSPVKSRTIVVGKDQLPN